MTSKLNLKVTNRSDAPAPFVIDLFLAEPSPIVIDARDDPNHVVRVTLPNDIWPGTYVEFSGEVHNDGNVKRNERGPMIWVRMPEELRGRFAISVCDWNGESLLVQEGWL